jgi:hypothetical protein
MKNQVIKNLNPEMGEKIIKYWKCKGVDTETYIGELCDEDGDLDCYYGIINDVFASHSIDDVERTNTEIIELPKEKSFPRKMLTWNGAEKFCEIRWVLFYTEKATRPYVCVLNSDTINYELGNEFQTELFLYAKELPEVNKEKEEIIKKADELIQKSEEILNEAKELIKIAEKL